MFGTGRLGLVLGMCSRKVALGEIGKSGGNSQDRSRLDTGTKPGHISGTKQLSLSGVHVRKRTGSSKAVMAV